VPFGWKVAPSSYQYITYVDVGSHGLLNGNERESDFKVGTFSAWLVKNWCQVQVEVGGSHGSLGQLSSVGA